MLGIQPTSPGDCCSTLVWMVACLCAVRAQPLGCNQQGQARVQTLQRGSTVLWQLPRAHRQVKGKAVLLHPSPPVVFREPVNPPAAPRADGV